MTEELDKIAAIQPKSQIIGEFLDWLRNEQGVELCQFKETGDNGKSRYSYYPRPASYSRESLDELYGENNWQVSTDEQRRPVIRVDNPCYESWSEGFYPVGGTIQDWLARYFGIDQHRAEEERQNILVAIRATHKEQA